MRLGSDRWFELRSYIRHFIRAKGPHGVHSPFVYNILTSVSERPIDPAIAVSLQSLRERMFKDSRTLQKSDLGTGISGEIRIERIAKRSSQPLAHSLFIAWLARLVESSEIVELGTSLGITTAALAMMNADAHVMSIEGCENTADVARANMKSFNLSHVDIIHGEAMKVLNERLPELRSADFVFIDCNHTYNATMEYIRFFISLEHPNLTIVLDDIYWSKEMNRAWRAIIAEGAFDISIDFFHFGVLFRRQGKVRENFTLRLPLVLISERS